MNEPHDLPAPGGVVASNAGGSKAAASRRVPRVPVAPGWGASGSPVGLSRTSAAHAANPPAGVPLDNAGAVRLYLRDMFEGIRTASRRDFKSDGRVERIE